MSGGDLVWTVVRLFVALPLVLGLAYLVLKYGLSRRYTVARGRPDETGRTTVVGENHPEPGSI